MTSAPHHPSSNECIKRAVETVKVGIQRYENGDLDTKLSRFLFSDRDTAHSTTGVTPTEMLMRRHLKTPFHLLRPHLRVKVGAKQYGQKMGPDVNKTPPSYNPGDPVHALIYRNGMSSCVPSTIDKRRGSVSYTVQLAEGMLVYSRIRHPYGTIYFPT